MLHAVKGKNFDLGGLEIDKILKYEEVLGDCLKDYFMPPEATQVLPLIPFSPMPGGALTANTQMMRDNGTLGKFGEVIKAMQEVVERGGYGTSVTPVSQFYWQQAYANVMFGPWEQIAPGYGKMVLGYFGKTPVAPDPAIVDLASRKLKLEPTTQNPLDIADKDEKKSIAYWTKRLEEESIETTEENIFIAAACDEKGITFLKGNGPLNVRKISDEQTQTKGKGMSSTTGNYTVVVNGIKYSVQIAEGDGAGIEIKKVEAAPVAAAAGANEEQISAVVNGTVWKILVKEGDKVNSGQTVVILEAMKMEIEIKSPKDGVVTKIVATQGSAVEEGNAIMFIA